MELSTQGILLRRYPYSETSLIVRWLTADLGRIATLARGAQRPKSPFRGRLDSCYLADLTLTPSRRSTLHTLKELQLQETFPGLRRDYAALQQAAYAIRLLERVTEPDTPLPGLFDLLHRFLETVSSNSRLPLHLLTFEWQLLDWSGQAPDPQGSPLDPETQSLFTLLLSTSPNVLDNLHPNRLQLESLYRFLGRCLEEQFGIPPSWRPPSPELRTSPHPENGPDQRP